MRILCLPFAPDFITPQPIKPGSATQPTPPPLFLLLSRSYTETQRINHEEVQLQLRACDRGAGHLQGLRHRRGGHEGHLQEGRRSPCGLVDAPEPLRVFRLQAQQQGTGDPLGKQAGQTRTGLQGPRDLGAEAVGDGEGEAEPGRADPAGGRRRPGVPPGLHGREGRGAGEGAPVLPLHHQRAHRRDALRLHPEDRLPQRPLAHRHLPRGRRREGAVQGGGAAQEDQDGQAQRERRQPGPQVHTHAHRRRLRVLVHGVRQLPEVLQVHAAGHLIRAMIPMALAAYPIVISVGFLLQRLVGARLEQPLLHHFLMRACSFLSRFGFTDVAIAISVCRTEELGLNERKIVRKQMTKLIALNVRNFSTGYNSRLYLNKF